MKPAIRAKLLFTAIFFLSVHLIQAQISSGQLGGADLNTVQTAVPFLTLPPDARASGMGDAGVASKTDVNSQHWNVAKYPFAENRVGVSLSYTPWLRNLIPDINMAYLSTYFKINDKNVLSSSFRYFSLGEIVFTSITGTRLSSYEPSEIAVDLGYSRLLTDHFSGGLVFRYIRSDLTSGQNTPDGQSTHAGTSIAGDIGLYYRNEFQMGTRQAWWALGMNLSNLGTPISYTDDALETPIPSNMRLGGRFQYGINDHHSLSLLADLNKLLVPSPAVYDSDTVSGEYFILRGKGPAESIVAGMFQSFSDAPGVRKSDGEYSVFQEEMYEIAYSLGLEYNFRDLIALRSGYFHEHATKGNRKYFTFGLGVINKYFSLDLSYLLPTKGQNSPLANTFRFSISTSFGRLPSIDPE